MVPFTGEYEFLINRLLPQLLTSTVCGALVGYGREKRNRPAGIRTNILIAAGCTLYSSLGFYLAEQNPMIDPTRIIGQIATGIGFLGAGAIVKSDQKVTGVTTAAFIWAISGISILIGYNMYLVPIVATLGLVLVAWAFEKVESRIHKNGSTD
ncbi:MAG: MgtC/SapB family protein [bacterium]|jgi:putative Mg2+ transporter-C (MgtC) family protein